MKTLKEVLKDWEAVIGLEVHTELTALDTKMFCGCKLSHDDEPNTNVCPVCLGMPGALPVPNEQAIRSIVKAGLAVGCTIEKRSMFYRKHYFYPDMAKNFQTTQGPIAFSMHGTVGLEVMGEGAKERVVADGVEKIEDGYVAPIRILRIHMEEDAAKMIHVGGEEGRIASATESLIDYNRCGTPLIELVTEPDLRTPEEARLFMEKLRRTFLALGISDCSMESGSMRCDGNVSLRRRGSKELGTKTELKNINSFKSLHDGLEYEIRRQAEVLENGGEVYQETRHWEPSKKRTVVMRVKETADDYRLFPDPDLAPFDLTDEFIESCRAELPELPDARRDRYMSEFKLKRADAAQLAADPEAAAFFDKAVAVKGANAVAVANLLVNDVAGHLKGAGLGFGDADVTPGQVASLAALLASDAITAKQGREVVELMAGTSDDPEKIVDARSMRQVTDDGALKPIVDEVVVACPDQVRQYLDGNERVVGFLVGQCMKRAKGSGNPKRFNELLVEAMRSGAAPAAEPAEKAEAKPVEKAEGKKVPAKADAKKAEPKKAEAKAEAPKVAAAEKKAPAKKQTPKKAAPKASEKPKTAAKPATVEKAVESKAVAKTVEKKATEPKTAAKPAAAKKAEPVSVKADKTAAAKPAAKAPAAKKVEAKPAAKTAAAKKAKEAKPAAATKVAKAEAPKPTAKAEPKADKPAVKAPATKAVAEKKEAPAKVEPKAVAPKVEAAAKPTAKDPVKETPAEKAPAKKVAVKKAAGAEPAEKEAPAAKAATAKAPAAKAAVKAEPVAAKVETDKPAAKKAPAKATAAKPADAKAAPKAADAKSEPKKAPAQAAPVAKAPTAAGSVETKAPVAKAPAAKAAVKAEPVAPKAEPAPKTEETAAPEAEAPAKKVAKPRPRPKGKGNGKGRSKKK